MLYKQTTQLIGSRVTSLLETPLYFQDKCGGDDVNNKNKATVRLLPNPCSKKVFKGNVENSNHSLTLQRCSCVFSLTHVLRKCFSTPQRIRSIIIDLIIITLRCAIKRRICPEELIQRTLFCLVSKHPEDSSIRIFTFRYLCHWH